MSFDLYFYTRKECKVDPTEIEAYLLKNGCVREDEFPQWVYENDDTNVYFVFERQPENDDPEDIEIFESFNEFDNTGLTFNLNFIRPNFFGLEAFPYVERFMKEFGLYALNLQSKSDPDNPLRQSAEEYYSDWSKHNLNFSSEYFDDLELLHFPLEISNDYWRYNFHRNELQVLLGDDYFVPTLILAREASTGRPITISTWTEHIPNVFPTADYFLLNRTKVKLFRTIEEDGLISRDRFMNEFGPYLEPFDFKDCYIIHPDKAAESADLFNTIGFDAKLHGFLGDGIDLSKLTNAERAAEQKLLDD